MNELTDAVLPTAFILSRTTLLFGLLVLHAYMKMNYFGDEIKSKLMGFLYLADPFIAKHQIFYAAGQILEKSVKGLTAKVMISVRMDCNSFRQHQLWCE